MRSLCRTLFAVLVAGLVPGALASAAAADTGTAPTITSVSVSNVTEHDATLEAQIDPNGLETAYEFQIDTNGSYHYTGSGCELEECDVRVVGEPLPAGLVEPEPEQIPAASGDQTVSLDLATIGATLQPATTYHYRVIASNGSGPTVDGPDQTFTTPSESTSPPEGGSEPSLPSSPSSGGQPAVVPVLLSPPLATVDLSSPPASAATKPEETAGNALELRSALKACERRPHKQWASCERLAHRRYGSTTKTQDKQSHKKRSKQ